MPLTVGAAGSGAVPSVGAAAGEGDDAAADDDRGGDRARGHGHPVAAAHAAALTDHLVGGRGRDGEVVGLAVEQLLESFSHCSLLPG